MIYTQANTKPKPEPELEKKDHILGCELIPTSCWSEDCNSFVTIWGLSIVFSCGQVFDFPDLCTMQSDVLKLKHRLDNASLSPESIYYIIDDFLGEIYGLPTE